MITSSLGGSLDINAIKPIKDKFVQKHSEDHIDCLVGAKTAQYFKEESTAFISNIRPLKILSVSGLNTFKLFGGNWKLNKNGEAELNPDESKMYRIPREYNVPEYLNKTVLEVVKSYEGGSKFAAVIYGSNNRHWFYGKFTIGEIADMLFFELKNLFDSTEFEVVFISTIFPRGEDLNEKGEVVSMVKEFNEYLLSEKTRCSFNRRIFINNKKGERVLLRWEIVNMTEELPYEEMKSLKYFCEKNITKKPMFQDFVHVNSTYLEKYYQKLDKQIQEFKEKKHRRKTNKKLKN